MNYDLQVHELLLFRHEVLRARLDIRDFFLKNTVREVYENIGQVLSLVRMQLAMLDTNKKAVIESIDSPGHLVGQSIRDLRVMCKSFYPDADILNEAGFAEALRDTITVLYQDKNPAITIKGSQKDILPELKLVVFKMIQEVLTLIKESGGRLVSVAIAYGNQQVTITLIYNGEAIPFDIKPTDDNICLTLQERAQLIKGTLSLTKGKNRAMQIQLSHPLNYPYE